MGNGCILYQGNALDSKDYFANFGFNMPRFGNPADYLIKIITFSYPIQPNDYARFLLLKDHYKKQLSEILVEN